MELKENIFIPVLNPSQDTGKKHQIMVGDPTTTNRHIDEER